jgi:perosamine synthetase
MELADEFGLKVFEDAAPALGAEVRGRKVGGIGHAAAFSFQGAKIMTCGEGGMFVTSDADLYERVKFLGDHGRDPHIPFFNTEVGYKYKMSNLAAAMGLAQVERIEELVARKRLIYSWYHERLSGVASLTLNVERPWARNIYWMSSIVLAEECRLGRDEVIAGLKARGVDSRPFFRPISSFPMFTTQAGQNPHAYSVSPRGINLPSGHNLTEREIDRVCDALLDVLQGAHLAAA